MLLDASNEIGTEVNAGGNYVVFTSRHQNAEENHNIKISLIINATNMQQS
jgi:hypothetical protein